MEEGYDDEILSDALEGKEESDDDDEEYSAADAAFMRGHEESFDEPEEAIEEEIEY